MKERIVHLGPFNNKKQDELLDKSLKYLKENRGNEFYYFLPNGELLKHYREHFIKQSNSTFEINIFTFDDIVDQILMDRVKESIGNPMKNLFIVEVLNNLATEHKLKYYKKLIDVDGFVHSLNDILGEIKRSLVSPKEYLERCPNKAKYKEIGYIYNSYENLLDEYEFWDREGSYLKSIELLHEASFIKDLKFIIIDGFYDFRPIELAIIKQLVKEDLDIYINIPFDMENRPLILEKTLYLLDELGFTIKNTVKENKNFFEKISSNLFGEEKELFKSKENIKIINAPTPYLELRRIFEEIKRIHSKGISLNDIALILTDPLYEEVLFKIAKEEELVISLDKRLSLRDIPITRELLVILENKISSGKKSKLISRVKSKYFPICSRDYREIYEYIIRKQNFEDILGFKDILHKGEELNIPLDYLEDLKYILEFIERELLDIPEEAQLSYYNEYLIKLIGDPKIMEKIFERYKANKKEEILLRDLKGVKQIQEVLEKIERLPLFPEKISLKQYYDILKEYLEDEEIIEKQGNPQGIHILNPINSRGHIKNTVFITGLSQENYPSLVNNSYFLNEYNIKELREIGLDVKSYKDNLSNETMKFASIIASSQERVYLSYSRGVENVGIPSMFIEELLELLTSCENEEGKKLEEIYIDLEYLIKKDFSSLTNSKDLGKYFLFKYFNEEKMKMGTYELYSSLNKNIIDKINDKIQGEVYRDKLNPNEYKGSLNDEKIIQDIDKNMNRVFSISYLESYMTCPYYFKLNNLFGIIPLERYYESYSPLEIGIIYHEVLKSYYLYYLEDIKQFIIGGRDFNIKSTWENLRKIVNQHAMKYKLDRNNKEDLLIIESIENKIMTFIEEDLKRLKSWQILPYEFEVKFGEESQFIIEKDDEQVSMRGRIDRIDRFIEKDQYLVMDYKSSSYGTRNIKDMKSGLSLQLPVYIMSQKDKDILLAAYGIINDATLEIKLGLVEETSILTRRNMGAISRKEWDSLMEKTKENIINAIRRIEIGDFSVNPLECSSYCIYKDICRYKDALEAE